MELNTKKICTNGLLPRFVGLKMQDLKEYQKQIIAKFDIISKKYEDTYCDSRSRACLYQDLFNLYKDSIEPFLGKELGKKVFKESLIQYCGFAYGVTVFKNLFSLYD